MKNSLQLWKFKNDPFLSPIRHRRQLRFRAHTKPGEQMTYWNHHDVPLQEDLISLWSCRPIGTLSNDLQDRQDVQKCQQHHRIPPLGVRDVFVWAEL